MSERFARWLSSPIFWGVAASLAYLGTVFWLANDLVDNWRDPISLNELGDFLAGVFAPLAFVWLVVAIFLQKSELSAQREELTLARESLGEQIVGQRKLIHQSEDQLGLLRSEEKANNKRTVRVEFQSELNVILSDAVTYSKASMMIVVGGGSTRISNLLLERQWEITDVSENQLAVLKDIGSGVDQFLKRSRSWTEITAHKSESRSPQDVVTAMKDIADRLDELCDRYAVELGNERLLLVARGTAQILDDGASQVRDKISADR